MREKYNEFPSLPVNPRLKFGVPLDEICENGILHSGLRDLFLKAYLNATADSKSGNGIVKENNIRQTLSPGANGQGSLDDRLMLKERLQKGKYIISYRTPPGAPLWLLRHFLGRLPEPLLTNSVLVTTTNSKIQPWMKLAEECRNAIELASSGVQSLRRLKFLVATELVHLSKENFSVLSALIGLIRNLAADQTKKNSLKKPVTFLLTCYFTQAITRRPYRPGNVSPEEKLFYPLVLFLIYYWPDLRKMISNMDSNYYSFVTSNEFNPRQSNSLPGFKRKPNYGHRKSNSLDMSFIHQKSNAINSGKNLMEKLKNENKLVAALNEKSKVVDKKSEFVGDCSSQVFEQILPISFKCDNCQNHNIIETKIRVSPMTTTSCNCMKIKVSQEHCDEENLENSHDKECSKYCSTENCIGDNKNFPTRKKTLKMLPPVLKKSEFSSDNQINQTENAENLVNNSALLENFPTLVHDKTSLIVAKVPSKTEVWINPSSSLNKSTNFYYKPPEEVNNTLPKKPDIGWDLTKIGSTSTPRNSDNCNSSKKDIEEIAVEPLETIDCKEFYKSTSSLETKSDSSKTTSSITKLFSRFKFKKIKHSFKMLAISKDQHNDSANLILIENRH